MTKPLPRIAAVSAETDTALRVAWRTGGEDVIELAGWLASLDAPMADLRKPEVFRVPVLASYGAAVAWGDPDGDLGIDAYHLELIAAEQRPFGRTEISRWQADMRLSNQEAADFLAVSLSTFNAYKAGATVPPQVAMVCRAALRDPVLVHAHHRPRKWGRPRKASV